MPIWFLFKNIVYIKKKLKDLKAYKSKLNA